MPNDRVEVLLDALLSEDSVRKIKDSLAKAIGSAFADATRGTTPAAAAQPQGGLAGGLQAAFGTLSARGAGIGGATGNIARQFALGAGGTAAAAVPMVGAALAGAEIISGAVAKLVRLPFNVAADGLNLISKSLNNLTQTLGPIGVAFDVASAGYKKAAEVLGSVPIVGELLAAAPAGMGAVVDGIKGVFEAMVSLGAKANPAIAQRLTYAISDAAAVIGRVFLPVIEQLTVAIRLFGDFMATILPSSDEMRQIFSALKPAFDELREALTELAPAFKAFVHLLANELAFAIATVARGFAMLLQVLKPIAQLLGFSGGTALADSFGASASGGHFAGIEEVGKQFQLAALASGQESIAQQQLDVQGQIRDNTSRILDALMSQTPLRAVSDLKHLAEGLWR